MIRSSDARGLKPRGVLWERDAGTNNYVNESIRGKMKWKTTKELNQLTNQSRNTSVDEIRKIMIKPTLVDATICGRTRNRPFRWLWYKTAILEEPYSNLVFQRREAELLLREISAAVVRLLERRPSDDTKLCDRASGRLVPSPTVRLRCKRSWYGSSPKCERQKPIRATREARSVEKSSVEKSYIEIGHRTRIKRKILGKCREIH